MPDVPPVPDVDFAVRARLTWSSLTVTVRPVVLSLADFLEPPLLPPHAAISTATRESATTEAARRERMRFTVPQHDNDKNSSGTPAAKPATAPKPAQS